MNHCINCGNATTRLNHGGCGGWGANYGCSKCWRVYEQTSGGFGPTGTYSYRLMHKFKNEQDYNAHKEKVNNGK